MLSLSLRQLFLSHVSQTSDAPLMLEIEKASGIYLFDVHGKQYIDLISGISVSNIGHCHPKVVEAVKLQAEKFMHLMVYGEYIHYPQVAFATLLTQQLPEKLNSVYFVNSGAEATEGAMKLAKRVTGRTEIIYCKNSYHGSTQGALSVMGDEYFKNAFRPLLPDTRMIRYGVEEDLKYISTKTAAIIIEPIQAESGVTVPDINYLNKVRAQCNITGALMILDEIQTGFGRTGKLFAFQHTNTIPDILLLAKGMGGGMPIGAFISSRENMNQLTNNPVLGHITTFGGHPVTCAAGKATLEVLLETKMYEQVEKKEKIFLEKLQHRAIKAVRSKGLLMAIEFNSFETNKKIIDLCIANGVITDWFLFAPHCMRIAPPFIITEAEINKACDVILQAISNICSE
jgi:acetylornithine/succinyldiaminopimelate/putrescine aminotransferase